MFLRNGAAHCLADDPASTVRDFAPSRWAPTTTIGRVEIDGPAIAHCWSAAPIR